MARPAKINWWEVKETWVQSHLQDAPLSLIEVARKFKIEYVTVRNKSSAEKWREELEKRMKEYEEIVTKKMHERTSAVLDKMNEEFVGNELEIRQRHAAVARGLQAKAVKRLSTIPIENLKAMEAIAMLKLGIDEERRALGLPDVFVRTDTVDAAHTEYKSLVEQMGDHARVKNMGVQLLKFLKEKATNVDLSAEMTQPTKEDEDGLASPAP